MLAIEEDIPSIPYSDPWMLSLPTRLKQLAKGQKRVAYFYELADNSTFRYRVYNMVQVLNESNQDISAAYFFLDDFQQLNEIANLADILVICRTRYESRVNQLVAAFKSRRKPVYFDIDDFVFNCDYAHLLLNALDQDVNDHRCWDFWFAYTSRLGSTLRLCDAAITTNANLAKQITEYANIPVSIIPNFLNREQLEVSDRIFAIKQDKLLWKSDIIHLGYFSGTPSHNKDFSIIIPALEALLENDPRICLVIAGYIEAGPRLERFKDKIHQYPFQDYVNLQRLIGSVVFNLMPLQNNVFTNCKSELKYFEAAIVGTQSIASPTYTYTNSIIDGVNGYLSKAHQWESTIKQAISEIDKYQEMSIYSYEHARDKYAWFNQINPIKSALGLI